MEEIKTYYAIIPADVRYDENLIPSAKLLYGEITALCNERGYCWATNEYFSQIYSASKRTIQTWLKSLSDQGYISIEFVKSADEKSMIRLIKISENSYHPVNKISCIQRKELHDPHEQNCIYNNTFNNSSSHVFEQVKNYDIEGKNKKVFGKDSDPYLLAVFLENNISENNPKFPKSELQRQRWAKDIDKMIRIDKLDPDDIGEVIEWCQKDSFWRSKILSGKKLREKYQQLRMKMLSK